jgi:hypothetical protein
MQKALSKAAVYQPSLNVENEPVQPGITHFDYTKYNGVPF